MKLAYTIKFRRDSSHRWREHNPVLAQAEPAYETDSGKFKIGDGTKRWNDLEYFNPMTDLDLTARLEAYVKALEEQASLFDEDGPSLFLLYENAKV